MDAAAHARQRRCCGVDTPMSGATRHAPRWRMPRDYVLRAYAAMPPPQICRRRDMSASRAARPLPHTCQSAADAMLIADMPYAAIYLPRRFRHADAALFSPPFCRLFSLITPLSVFRFSAAFIFAFSPPVTPFRLARAERMSAQRSAASAIRGSGAIDDYGAIRACALARAAA